MAKVSIIKTKTLTDVKISKYQLSNARERAELKKDVYLWSKLALITLFLSFEDVVVIRAELILAPIERYFPAPS